MKRSIKNVVTNNPLVHLIIIAGVGLLSDADHLIQRFAPIELPDKFLHAPLVLIAGVILVIVTASFLRLLMGAGDK